MNEIALDLDLHNELEFKVSVEGTKPAEASCRLMFENSGFNLCFPGSLEDGGKAVVIIPPLEHVLEEGNKKATLEMIVDDRIFKPLELQVNFKKSVKVFAEAVVKEEVFQKPSATAVLVTKSKSKEKIIENTPQPLPPSNLDETAKDIKPDWPIENNNSQAAKTQKIIDSTLSNLTEDDLRDKIRSLLMSKRK